MRVSGVKLLNLGNTEDILGREIELGEMRGGWNSIQNSSYILFICDRNGNYTRCSCEQEIGICADQCLRNSESQGE